MSLSFFWIKSFFLSFVWLFRLKSCPASRTEHNLRPALLAGDLSGLKSHTKERFDSNKAWAHLCTKIYNICKCMWFQHQSDTCTNKHDRSTKNFCGQNPICSLQSLLIIFNACFCLQMTLVIVVEAEWTLVTPWSLPVLSWDKQQVQLFTSSRVSVGGEM